MILTQIAKHGPTARGRLKTAALNAIVNDYGIKDGRAEPAVVAIRVGKLLDRKNFTFRECTEEVRSFIRFLSDREFLRLHVRVSVLESSGILR